MAQPVRDSWYSTAFRYTVLAANVVDAGATACMLITNPEDTAARTLRLSARVLSTCVTHRSPALLKIAAVATNIMSLAIPSTTTDILPPEVRYILGSVFEQYFGDGHASTYARILTALNIANIGLPH